MALRHALTVVGTGIRCGTDLGENVRAALVDADEVFVVASDPISFSVLQDIRPDATSLGGLYGYDVVRSETYKAMVERVLDRVRAGRRVCFAIPGHPGVFAEPTHEAIRRARAECFSAIMLPAISSADHLYADLAVDPGAAGSVNFEATDFLLRGTKADPTVALILWQIGAIGERCYPQNVNRNGLRLLSEVLVETYPPSHQVTVYEAARYALCDPLVLRVRLDELSDSAVPLLSTLYVPPAAAAPVDSGRLARLKLASISA